MMDCCSNPDVRLDGTRLKCLNCGEDYGVEITRGAGGYQTRPVSQTKINSSSLLTLARVKEIEKESGLIHPNFLVKDVIQQLCSSFRQMYEVLRIAEEFRTAEAKRRIYGTLPAKRAYERLRVLLDEIPGKFWEGVPDGQ